MSYIVRWQTGLGLFNSLSFDEYNAAITTAKLHSKYLTAREHSDALSVCITDSNTGLTVWNAVDHPALKQYEEYSPEQWKNLQAGHHETYNKPSVYFDIDGTLGKWYPDGRGFAMEEIFDPANHYFRHIEPHPAMILLAKLLQEKGVDVCIISAAERETIRDKWEWIDEHCPFIRKSNICFAPIGADKSNFVKGNAECSILIDDYNRNLQEWKGTAIKAINTVNSHQDIYGEINFTKCEQQLEKAKCNINMTDQALNGITKSVHNIARILVTEIKAKERSTNHV